MPYDTLRERLRKDHQFVEIRTDKFGKMGNFLLDEITKIIYCASVGVYVAVFTLTVFFYFIQRHPL